jgi:hypothetical protein
VSEASPASHRDLAECPPVAALTTMMSDGSPHLDAPTRADTGCSQYDGYVSPIEQAAHETRVIGWIHATRITLDAVHPRALVAALNP